MDEETRTHTPNWTKAVVAGIVATLIMTITMALFGQNIVKMLGSMILGAGAGTAAQYFVGGLMHFVVGIVYALIYAWFFGPIKARGPLLKGTVYGFALTGMALATMPVMSSLMGGGAANPCNPCAGAAAVESPCNPCNPCGGDAAPNPCNPCNPCGGDAAANPCNPCTGSDSATTNPCNPCQGGASGRNPCDGAANPCNPCNPCAGGGGNPTGALVSLLNHLVYSLALALIYGRD